MSDLLVSIAICTYNGDKYFAEQLESITNQTYRNLEIVIMDDGSVDDTIAIAKKFARTDDRITVIQNERNLGYVKNFEKAIYFCNGDYIALSDQDDIWQLNKIELLVNEIKGNLLIYHDSQLINEQGKALLKISDLFNMYEGNSPLPFLFYNCVSGHSCMFKKSLVLNIEKTGSLDPNFHHDWRIAFLAANYGSIRYINQPLVKYRQHGNANTDILNIQKKQKKPRIKYPDINIAWLKYCLTVPGEHSKLIKTIITLWLKSNWFSSVQLVNYLSRHCAELFFLKKKSQLSKLNYMRKMAFDNTRHNK